ncbi:hypothetical protein PHMEG_00039073 [Phytophthora megakarya]|uniref:Retrotransposon gag domain-containing protein n=1 Tax=Phytophthora megakarya TaxID=4795 RepID=A0A225UGA0_9STRA|nr:hypothetical protein PHMEG_00039073 [Phytophthora megakarya]
MKIRQFRSRVPVTIRDWYAQLPNSTHHNWKLLSTKFKKLYCCTTGSYAERYFTIKMRSSETALQFFYRLNTAAVKAEIPFQTSSKRRELHLRGFVKKLKDVQLKTALEGHQFQSISEVERVLRRHEDVWRKDGCETPPTRTRDDRADNLPRGGLKPWRPGHAFLTQNVDSRTLPLWKSVSSFRLRKSRTASGETPDYGPDDYVPSMPEMTDESYEGYRVSEWSEQQRMENRNTFCEKCKKAFKTVKHLASQGMLNDTVPSQSQTLAQLQMKDTGQGKQQLNH